MIGLTGWRLLTGIEAAPQKRHNARLRLSNKTQHQGEEETDDGRTNHQRDWGCVQSRLTSIANTM